MDPGIILAIILIVTAAVAVYVGRSSSVPGLSGGNSGESRKFFGGERAVVKAIVGSEREPFFKGKKVQKALAFHGYAVEVETVGSRRMAADVNLDSFDMTLPSSVPTAEKITEKMSGAKWYDVFYTPMAIVTFDNILQIPEWGNVTQKQGTTW